jgi:putative ABC transport system permease protein
MGFVSGSVLSRIGLWALSQNVSENFHYDFQLVSLLKEEYWLLLGTLAIGLLAAALPSMGIYKINISKTLAEE